MLHEANVKDQGFRELNIQEVEYISGGNGGLYGDEYLGNIVVTGLSGGGISFGLGGAGGIGNLGTTGVVIGPGLIDYNDDGFADEIIVTANENQVDIPFIDVELNDSIAIGPFVISPDFEGYDELKQALIDQTIQGQENLGQAQMQNDAALADAFQSFIDWIGETINPPQGEPFVTVQLQ